MLKKIGALVCLIAWGSMQSLAVAQHQIAVCVVDEQTGQPVSDAYVQILHNGESQGVFAADNTVCGAVSPSEDISRQEPSTLSVSSAYPNPTSGSANVLVTSLSSPRIRYELYDLLGRKVAAGTRVCTNDRADLSFDLSDKAPGVYLARISNDDQSQTIKIVKQHDAPSASGLVSPFSATRPTEPSRSSFHPQMSQADTTRIHVSVLEETGNTIGSYFSQKTTHLIDRDTTLTIAVRRVPSNQCEEQFAILADEPELICGLTGLQDLLEYPEEASVARVQGRVFVNFLVDKQGRVSWGQVVRGIGAGADTEAMRLIHLADFTPGTRNGEPVCFRMSLPILFELD